MKVLVVSPLPPPSGGIATWTEGLCNYFQGGREGVSIVVLNTSLTGHRAEVVSNHRNFWDEIKRTWKLLRAFRRMLRGYPFPSRYRKERIFRAFFSQPGP